MVTMRAVIPLVLLAVAATIHAVPTLGKREAKLSEEKHYPGDGHDHNADYDHEAFLGKEEAGTFDQLPPSETNRRLGMIVDKIDGDKDGQVTFEELEKWINHVGKKYIYDDVDRVWSHYDRDEDGYISFDNYKEESYDSITNLEEIYDDRRNTTYKERFERDGKKFKVADENSDGRLDKEEFANFLHPEESAVMIDVYVDEILYDMDHDKDGVVTLKEYIDDIWPNFERSSSEEEPDWVTQEKKNFNSHRDKNGDGKLDRDEIKHWMLPEGYDHAQSETRHLIYNADANKDKMLSKEEILSNHDLFVGSQATEWGEYMMRHDEF